MRLEFKWLCQTCEHCEQMRQSIIFSDYGQRSSVVDVKCRARDSDPIGVVVKCPQYEGSKQ